jgi:hypothetical protein
MVEPTQLLLFAAVPPLRPADPDRPTSGSGERNLDEMRATSAFCIASLANWHQRHKWTVGGTCERCGLHWKTAP